MHLLQRTGLMHVKLRSLAAALVTAAAVLILPAVADAQVTVSGYPVTLDAAPAGSSSLVEPALAVPPVARQLVVVASPVADPAGSITVLRAYARAGGSDTRWRLVFGPWAAEAGTGGLIAAAQRREGDRATPSGMFGFG